MEKYYMTEMGKGKRRPKWLYRMGREILEGKGEEKIWEC